MTRESTAIDRAIAKRLGSAFIVGLRAAENLLRLEARKHLDAVRDIENEDPDSEEGLLHSIEAESLQALADRISQLPNPYYGLSQQQEASNG